MISCTNNIPKTAIEVKAKDVVLKCSGYLIAGILDNRDGYDSIEDIASSIGCSSKDIIKLQSLSHTISNTRMRNLRGKLLGLWRARTCYGG